MPTKKATARSTKAGGSKSRKRRSNDKRPTQVDEPIIVKRGGGTLVPKGSNQTLAVSIELEFDKTGFNGRRLTHPNNDKKHILRNTRGSALNTVIIRKDDGTIQDSIEVDAGGSVEIYYK